MGLSALLQHPLQKLDFVLKGLSQLISHYLTLRSVSHLVKCLLKQGHFGYKNLLFHYPMCSLQLYPTGLKISDKHKNTCISHAHTQTHHFSQILVSHMCWFLCPAGLNKHFLDKLPKLIDTNCRRYVMVNEWKAFTVNGQRKTWRVGPRHTARLSFT